MTISSRVASHPMPKNATQAAWLFPGRTELAITVNWCQAAVDTLVDDLRLARELEDVKDSVQIARLRRLSARCELALARCRAL